MKNTSCSPYLHSFLESRGSSWVFAQVLVSASPDGHTHVLRHVQDRDRSAEDLDVVPPDDLSEWAIHDDRGGFRPLKAAPTLKRGWICHASNLVDLERALESLYPGSIADWVTAQETHPPITDFKSFTNRQTGMYRNASQLSDEEAKQVIQATCHKDSCLKMRRWELNGPSECPPNQEQPACMEPCAILLEMARKRFRFKQTPPLAPQLSEQEWLVVRHALEKLAGERIPVSEREADLSFPGNPRLARLVLSRLSDPDSLPA